MAASFVDCRAAEAADASGVWTGFLRSDVAYGARSPDQNFPFTRRNAGISKARTSLALEYERWLSEDWKLRFSGSGFYDAYYAAKGREQFSAETLDAFESEIEIRDTYLDGPITDTLALRLGWQVLAWGEAEALQITDMVNPRDLRETGEARVEDIRVPILAAKLSWLWRDWELNFAAIPERRPAKLATAGADFDPYITLRGSPIVVRDEYSESEYFQDAQAMVRAYRTFPGVDLALIGGSVFDHVPHLEFESYDAATGEVALKQRQKRIGVLGFATNVARGSWMYRTEVAWKSDVALQRRDLFPARFATDHGTWLERDVVQGLMGIDYTGIGDLFLSFELGATRVLDYEPVLATDETVATWSFTGGYDLLNQRLRVLMYWTRFSEQGDHFSRVTVTYDHSDHLQFTAGATVYEAPQQDGLLYPSRRNDRLRVGFKLSF
jgi:hypothetical protein